AHGVVFVVPVEELVEALRGQSVLPGQPLAGYRLETLRHAAIELGPVAGGEDHRLLDPGLPGEVAQRLRCHRGVECHLLAQADRRGEVIEPEGDEWHDGLGSAWVASAKLRAHCALTRRRALADAY